MLPFRPRRSLRPARPRLTRRAVLWYLAAGALVVATGLTVHGTAQRAAEAEAAFGQTRPVVVVTRAVAAGATVTGADVEVRRWPRALAVADALTRPPAGRTALVPLVPGEPLLAARVSGAPGQGPAALLGPDERAVVVPVVVPGLPLDAGDGVDVLAGGAVGGGPAGDLPVGGDGPDVVAEGATVLRAGREAVVVAVPADDAAAIAAALT